MKKFLLSSVLFLTVSVAFPQARIQVVHNSADAFIAVMDVWLDGTLLLDNFAFRTASPFMDAPAGTEFTIAIKGPDSQDPDNPFWSHTYTLTDGEAYVMVADGIIHATGYDPATPFSIEVFAGGLEVANQSDKTDMLSHHGSTDAPTIDIYETLLGGGLLVDNLSYAEFDGYLELATNDYIFEVRDESGSTVIGAYTASFQELGLKGKAITLLASGFLYPENNSNGPAFGLWVAPAEGGALIELPVNNPKAHVQLIHNSADAAAAIIDVWLNDTLLLDNFAFRTSSTFIDVPAEQEFTLAVKGPDSQDPDDPIWSGNYTLTTNETYIMVAEGIVSTSGYDPATPFDIAVFPQGREMADLPANTDMLVHHGSTDAPTIDIYEIGTGAGLLVDNLGYAGFSGYLELEPLDYIFEVRDETGTVALAAYEVPLETLGLDSYALTVVASGFLDPGNNSNGAAFGLWFATAAGGNLIELPVYNPTARVQILHNSADAAAAVIDVWLNETLLLDNFAFQTASPFIDIPAENEITISVAGPDSQNPANPLWSHNYTLTEDDTYILVAEGIISSSGYEPATPFDVAVYPQGREVANQSSQTDMLIHHGSTDAPGIDIFEVGIGVGQIVDNLAYSEFAGYFGLATVNYIFQVRDETGFTKIAAYEVPLASMGLQGDAVTIVASGFLYPENNSNGPEFALYMTLASGGPMIRLALYAPTARVQVVHNSADALVGLIDVWLNQNLLFDDFAFRTASPFIDAPADEQFTISIKGPDSQDPFNPLWFHNYTLIEGQTYVFVAEGILSSSGYTPPTPFDMAVYPNGREEASLAGRTDILVHHGSTDAPVVDVIEVGLGAGTLVEDLSYAEFSTYLELPTIDYIFEIRDQESTLLGSYRAPLQTYGMEDEAITIVASGFVDPDTNSNGAAFGLWAARPAGGPLVELPFYQASARVQIIHNSADASVSEVDVWIDENRLIDNFAFRTATPYEFIPSGEAITLAVTLPDSQDPDNPLWSQSYTLVTDETYIMVANGILSPTGYDPALPFNIHVYEGAIVEATVSTNTDVLIFHGATDAPTVDVVETATGAGTISDNLSYSEFDGYLELPTDNYELSITDESGATVVAIFDAPLADLDLDGKSLTLLASGFLDPSVNSNGPAFGLLAVQADGTAIMLTNTFGVEDVPVDISTFNVYPNPATDRINISYELRVKSRIVIEIADITGRMMKTVDMGTRGAGTYQDMINVEQLPSGMYLLNIWTGEDLITRKVFVR